MYKLMYIMNDSTVVESFIFHSRELAQWKKNQLLNQGSHRLGTFKIQAI